MRICVVYHLLSSEIQNKGKLTFTIKIIKVAKWTVTKNFSQTLSI